MAGGQHGKVGDGGKDELCRGVHAVPEAALADRLHVCDIWRGDKLLKLGEHVRLCVSIDELSIDELFLDARPCHLEEFDELLKLTLALGTRNDLGKVARVVAANVRVDTVAGEALVELRLGHLCPHLWLGHALGVLKATIDGLDLEEQHIDRIDVVVELFVDLKGLFIEHVVILPAELGDGLAVEIVEPVDVVHDLGLVGIGRSDDEQVLQVGVVGELRRALQDDLLQELDELRGKIRVHERLDGGAERVRALVFRKRRADDLVDELVLVAVPIVEHLCPEIGVLALDEVPCLVLEEAARVGELDELLVASAPCALVREEGEVWVELFAELSHDL